MQRAINQFASLNTPRAVLHDEFRRLDATEWQKRVWVQNSGNSPFIARISASEFMQWIEAEDWSRGRNIIEGVPFADPIPAAIETTLTPTLDSGTWGADGTLIDTQTAWFNVTPDMWSIRGLTDPASLTQASPARGHAADGTPFSEYWEWNSDHLTYTEWTALPLSQRSNKWVLADDGFFYYTSVIRPETNTLPLMTGVSAASGFDPLKHAFYYAIDIQMEVVTQDDVSAMKDGLVPSSGTDGVPLRAASTQGRAILDSMTWTAPSIIDLTINGESTSLVGNEKTVTLGSATPALGVEANTTGIQPLTYLWQRKNTIDEWETAPGSHANATYYASTSVPGTFTYRALVSNSGAAPVEGDGFTSISGEIRIIGPTSPLGPQAPTGGIPQRHLGSTAANAHMQFDGIWFWRIASVNDGTYTYDLIVTENVYHDTPYTLNSNMVNTTSDTNAFWLIDRPNNTKSNLMANMDAWFNHNAPLNGELRDVVVAPAFTGAWGNGNTTATLGIEHADGTIVTGTLANTTFATYGDRPASRPSTTLVNNAAADTNPANAGGIIAFPLSGLEVVNFFPDGVNDARTSGMAARATSATQLGRIGHDSADSGSPGTARDWWIRSRGNTSVRAGIVDAGGRATGSWGNLLGGGEWASPSGGTVTLTSRGIRPALWVRR
ncbi:MAG: hypothetical protein FWG78_01735 [Coriobacteriia bacterium]|nr:hypothetical protein [Coriobacteriia bacterium]